MRRSAPLLLALLALLPALAAAQFPGEVRGRVMDAQAGSPVAGALVAVRDAATATRTEGDGSFVLRGVLPGTRVLRVEAFGYRESLVEVRVENGRSERIFVRLDPDPVALEGLTVATRAGAAGSTVIERASIRASGARELGELLRDRAGVTVTRLGGAGAPARVSIRGSGSDEVLVLVDGTPINSLLTGDADLSTIPLEAVERVTVLRGAQSARYGSRALAGAVLVETRKPSAAELSITTAAGAWGERRAALSLADRVDVRGGTAGGVLSGEWQSSEGDFRYAVPAVRGGGEALRRNGDARIGSLLATGSLERGATALRLRADGLRAERGMPGSIVQPSPRARQEQRRTTWGAAVTTAALGVRWRGTVDLQRQAADFNDPRPPLGAPYAERAQADGLTGSLAAAAELGPLLLDGGLDGRRVGFSSTMTAGAPPRQRSGAAWGQLRVGASLGSGWEAEIAPAVRVDRSSLLPGWIASPRLAGELTRGPLALFGTAGSGFSPPSLADQFFHEGVLTRPNPELEPERVRRDLQVGGALRDRLRNGGEVQLELAAFRADVEGMILWAPDHRFVWSPHNFDVTRRGWESSVALGLPSWRTDLSASVSHVRVEYASGALSGQVAYRPALTASGSAAATLLGVRAGTHARFVGGRRVSPGSSLNALPPHWLADARLARGFRRGGWDGELSLALENLFDRHAAMLIDYPYPGRSWSLRFQLRRSDARSAPDRARHTDSR